MEPDYCFLLSGDPFLFINATSPNGVEFTVEANPFFSSHVKYVYASPTGEVMLRLPLWGSSFTSLQFVVAVRDRLSSQVNCRTAVTMVVRRNLYAPVVTPGQQTLSKFYHLQISWLLLFKIHQILPV